MQPSTQPSTPASAGASDKPTPPVSAAYGTWSSPISAASLAEAAIAMSDLRSAAGAVYWRESRPAEGGRQVLMRRSLAGQIEQLTPTGFNVRTRVHEYGGNAYVVLADGVVFVNFADQRLYWQRDGAQPVVLTPAGFQYADGVLDRVGKRMFWVREDHRAETKKGHGEERNEIVSLPLPSASNTDLSAGTVLVTGTDFVAYPRVSPDGKRLAWVSWNHPDMPWDQTGLYSAELKGQGLGKPVPVSTRPRVAALEPSFADDGQLYFVADPKGWWNLQRAGSAENAFQPVLDLAREFSGPLWQLGASTYALIDAQTALVRTSLAARDELALLDLKRGAYRALDLPFVAFGEVQMLGPTQAVALAQSSTDHGVLISIDPASGDWKVLHQPTRNTIAAGYLSVPEAISFETAVGPNWQPRKAHAWYYPPSNPDYQGPAGEKPPLIVTIHGGPTSVSKATLNLSRQYWTSRGFALVDVNYGGSTTYGRAYRERLLGQWGIVDVADAIAATDYLIAQGRVDPERVAIRGGSAGGYTTLAALAFHDRFKAGANYFGVSDIAALAATSHKFERQYDVSLVGQPNEALYRSRSPLFHLDGFREPLITFQGSEDKVVPPAQSQAIVAALDARKIPHAYIEFAGEQHGFRQAANIVRAQEAELYFYGQIFGFTPADPIEPVVIAHWPAYKNKR